MNKSRLSAGSLFLHSTIFSSLVIDREQKFMRFDDKKEIFKTKYNLIVDILTLVN